MAVRVVAWAIVCTFHVEMPRDWMVITGIFVVALRVTSPSVSISVLSPGAPSYRTKYTPTG